MEEQRSSLALISKAWSRWLSGTGRGSARPRRKGRREVVGVWEVGELQFSLYPSFIVSMCRVVLTFFCLLFRVDLTFLIAVACTVGIVCTLWILYRAYRLLFMTYCAAMSRSNRIS